jgi:hypothetical protein
MLERDAFIVTPKEPFTQWAGSIDAEASVSAKELIGQQTIYLASNDILDVNAPPLI